MHLPVSAFVAQKYQAVQHQPPQGNPSRRLKKRARRASSGAGQDEPLGWATWPGGFPAGAAALGARASLPELGLAQAWAPPAFWGGREIGRASCRERV